MTTATNLDDENTSYLQAIIALVVTGVCLLAYAVVDAKAGAGWFRDFLIAALPNAAIVSGAYATLYFVFNRRGLTAQQQLSNSVAAGVAERLDVPTSVEQIYFDSDEPDWPQFLREADRVVVAARSLARWSTNNHLALRDFFERGGRMEVVSHDPARAENIALVAASHSGYGTRNPDRVRTNIESGLYRIAAAADDGQVEFRYVTDDEFVFTLSLFVLYRKARVVRVVLRPVENVRAGVTSAPVLVLRPDVDGALAVFAEREIDGLRRISDPVEAARVRALGG